MTRIRRGGLCVAIVVAGMLAASGRASAAFGVREKWHDWACALNSERCLVGDFNGDGRDDVASVSVDGIIFIVPSDGKSFLPAEGWAVTWPFGLAPFATVVEMQVADVDHSGTDDIVVLVRSSTGLFAGDVHVAISSASTRRFTVTKWHETFALPSGGVVRVGDINGDGCADLTRFTNNSAADVLAVRSRSCEGTGSFEASEQLWHNFFSPTGEKPLIDDFDGDGLDDIGTLVPANPARVFVARSFGKTQPAFQCKSGNGTCLNLRALWGSGICTASDRVCLSGDFNGDGQADIGELNPSLSATTWSLFASDGTAFSASAQSISGAPCRTGETCLVGDFNGDRRDDYVALTRQAVAQGDAWVTLSGPNPERLACSGTRASGCNGVLSFGGNSWVDTNQPISGLTGLFGEHTVSFKAYIEFDDADLGAFVASAGPWGDYEIRKEDAFSGRLDGARLDVRLSSNSVTHWANDPWAFKNKRWYHVAVTVSPALFGAPNIERVYIDGFPVKISGSSLLQETLPANWNWATGNVRFGNSSRERNPKFHQLYGLLDDVAFYNRELSASEVAALGSKTSWTGTELGLVGAWTFDNASAPPARVDGPLRIAGNAQRVTYQGSAVDSAFPSTTHDSPATAGAGGNYLYDPPLENGSWFVIQGADMDEGPTPQPPPPGGPSHRGYASFCLDLGRSDGVPSRGQKIMAAARGQVIFARRDSLDTASLPPYAPNGSCSLPAGECGKYEPPGPAPNGPFAPNLERLVAGCTPCDTTQPLQCAYPGNEVILRHGPQQYTGYLHLKEFSVEQRILDKLRCYYDPECTDTTIVERGEVIGLLGRSGVRGDHLHFAALYRPRLNGEVDSRGTAWGSYGVTGANLPAGTGEAEWRNCPAGLEQFCRVARRTGTVPNPGTCGYRDSTPGPLFDTVSTRPFRFDRYVVNGVTVRNSLPDNQQTFVWTR